MGDVAADAATAVVDTNGDAKPEDIVAAGADGAASSDSDAPSSPASGAGSGAGAGAGDSAEARAARSLSYKAAGNDLFKRTLCGPGAGAPQRWPRAVRTGHVVLPLP